MPHSLRRSAARSPLPDHRGRLRRRPAARRDHPGPDPLRRPGRHAAAPLPVAHRRAGGDRHVLPRLQRPGRQGLAERRRAPRLPRRRAARLGRPAGPRGRGAEAPRRRQPPGAVGAEELAGPTASPASSTSSPAAARPPSWTTTCATWPTATPSPWKTATPSSASSPGPSRFSASSAPCSASPAPSTASRPRSWKTTSAKSPTAWPGVQRDRPGPGADDDHDVPQLPRRSAGAERAGVGGPVHRPPPGPPLRARRRRRAGDWPTCAAEPQAVLRTTDEVVKRQAEVWAKALDEINRRHAEAAAKAQERLTTALEAALEKTLKSHAERLAASEKVSGKLLEQVAALAAAVDAAARGAGEVAGGREAPGAPAGDAGAQPRLAGRRRLVRGGGA